MGSVPHAGNGQLAVELATARQAEAELRQELERLRNTRTFRWTRPARDLYGQLLAQRERRNQATAVLSALPPIVDPQPAPPTPTPEAIVSAFEQLYPGEVEGDLPPPVVQEAIIRQFHRLFYYNSFQTWRETRHRGVNVYKDPMDLWVYQELIHEIRPELVIETGTMDGGSAYFLADMCAIAGAGTVVTIDIEATPGRPEHERLIYLHGSSTDPAIVARVMDMLPEGPVLAILDSDHSYAHVRQELSVYAPLVTPDSYIVVEDTNINGHPVMPNFQAGPMEAVQEFLTEHPEYKVDHSREKFMVTWNPSGFLRRIGETQEVAASVPPSSGG
ncbi:MAG: CmcI family methyltransferase [Acidimicrobiales bacterium]